MTAHNITITIAATTITRRYDMYMIYFLFNCNWVATRWQLFSTHIHTNNTGNVTKQTSHRKTQKKHRTTQKMHYIEQKNIMFKYIAFHNMWR
jgi:hypothetical protein